MRKVVTKEGITFTIETVGNDIVVISDSHTHPFDDIYELGIQLKTEAEKINLDKINVILDTTNYHNNHSVVKLIYDKHKQTITMEE